MEKKERLLGLILNKEIFVNGSILIVFKRQIHRILILIDGSRRRQGIFQICLLMTGPCF